MRRGMGLVVGLVVVVFVLLLVGGSYVSSKNQMVGKDQDVKASWSDIDTTLQRRADLIPNLVETVKGYAKHEETVFADIANARAGLLNAHSPEEKIQANGRLDRAAGRLERFLGGATPDPALVERWHAAATEAASLSCSALIFPPRTRNWPKRSAPVSHSSDRWWRGASQFRQISLSFE